MYACLCRKIMEQINPKVQDDSIKDGEGKPFAGGKLFRRYLLNCCHEVSERGWITKETTAAAASKATEDRVVKGVRENPQGQESELFLDECYAMAKVKHHTLGLICFVGELFMLQILTERIVHKYIKKLLSNKETEEEEIESVCKLLRLVGGQLDMLRSTPIFLSPFNRHYHHTSSISTSTSTSISSIASTCSHASSMQSTSMHAYQLCLPFTTRGPHSSTRHTAQSHHSQSYPTATRRTRRYGCQ